MNMPSVCRSLSIAVLSASCVRFYVASFSDSKLDLASGTQLTSKRASSARACFGTGRREDCEKQYMDAELEKCKAGRGTPGPVYKHLLGIGKQALSTAPSAARTHFGTAPRFKHATRHSMNMTPGAGQYATHKSALGKQVYSKKKTLPSFGFGTSTRQGMESVCPSPPASACHLPRS